MCAKKAPRTYNSPQTQHFIQERGIITGQVLGVKFWLQRHRLPICSN